MIAKAQSIIAKVLVFNLLFVITFDIVILSTSMIIGLSFVLFHQTGSHCKSQRKQCLLEKLIAINTKFLTVLAISFELAMTAMATTIALIICIIDLREFAPNCFVSINFDNVKATAEANTKASAANIGSFLVRVTTLAIILSIVVRIAMIAVSKNTLTSQKLLHCLLSPHIILVKILNG